MKIRRRRLRGENGQALVEFALILPLFLFLIVGIIQFGIGLNYWLDLTHTANQGARYAVVNLAPVCNGSAPTPCNGTSFNTFLKNELTSGALKNGGTQSIPSPGATATYCYVNDNTAVAGPNPGEPITVAVSTDYRFIPFLNMATVKLVGKATMRMEQFPTRLAPATC